ncbi:glycosyltransferase family 4 protein [Fortiea contorta]|uniref:glycosyltransferase family 4 protein n=1 Tax=Fortiea contorta TaxID=1892405 RepID=UPI00034B4155|nr:glycosyltransferase family 4 protein [Fortiea contorta]
MRILHLTNHVQEIGNGIVNVAVDLACLQAENGHHVAVASSGGEYEILLANYGVQHLALDQSRTPINLIKAAWHYQEIIREFQPDIVHAHMMTGVLLARLLRNSSEYSLVSTVHNEFQRSAVLMGLADRVIAVSQAVAGAMVRRGIPKNKLRVVSNGTLSSPRHQKIREYQPLPLQRPAIATVAGMYTRKGIVELITAFVKIAADFPQAHLYLVGNGPDRPIFEALAQNTPVSDRIHFEGFQAQPQRYMLATDIFVLASHCESFGLVLTEAREAGCAIVASDVDGIPETLDYGQAGLLVPPQNSHTLANALFQLLSHPKQLQKWQYKATQNLERFSTTRVYAETMAVYYELVKNYDLPRIVRTEEFLVSK